MSKKHRKTLGTIRVQGRNIKVTHQAKDGFLGWFDPETSTINVAPGQSITDTKDTLLHEVMHVILNRHGSRADEGGKHYAREEAYVLPLATGLIQFFRDNPKVAEWLIQDPAYTDTAA